MKTKKRAFSRLLGAAALGASALAVGGTAATTLFTQSAGAVGCVHCGDDRIDGGRGRHDGGTVTGDRHRCHGLRRRHLRRAHRRRRCDHRWRHSSDGVTVSGANDTGIFVDQASTVTIENDTVQNNGVAPGTGTGVVRRHPSGRRSGATRSRATR